MSEEIEFGDIRPFEALGLRYTSDSGRKRRGTYLFECPRTGWEWIVWTKGSKTHAWKVNCPRHDPLPEGQWSWPEVIRAVEFTHSLLMRRLEDACRSHGFSPGDTGYLIRGADRRKLRPFMGDIRGKFADTLNLVGADDSFDRFGERVFDDVRTNYKGEELAGYVIEVTGPTAAAFISFVRATDPDTVVIPGKIKATIAHDMGIRFSVAAPRS